MTRLAARGHEVRVLCGDERIARARCTDANHERHVFRELRPPPHEGTSARPSLRERAAIERRNRAVLERHLETYRPDVVSGWHMVAIPMTVLRRLEELGVPTV